MDRRLQSNAGVVLALVIGLLLASGNAGLASASTRWVNDDDPNGGLYAPPGTSCTNPGYATVQSAVNAAAPGDHINVCPGTYTEEVSIPVGKNNIRLRSVQQWEAIIKAPPMMLGPTKAIIRVSGAQDVTILAFTITGPGGSGCDSLRYGVRVDMGGSANILGNHITHIRDNPFSGCQNGLAVLVGRLAEATNGSAKIIGNVIDNYQKNGPTIDNVGSHAEIAHNRILGVGPTALIAQNGVQASRGATANIRHNLISGHVYTPQTFVATGLILFQSGDVLTEHNTLSSNDVGVDLFATAGSTIALNRVRASTFDGIALFPETNSRVMHNKVDQNNGPGIGIYDSQDNTLEDNKVEDNNDSGLLLDNADNNAINDNKVRNNGAANGDLTDGIRVNVLSTDNILQNNHLKNNVTHDCHDDSVGTGTAGTSNSWVDNHGETAQPAGLCGGDADDASFQTSITYGWDANYPWYDAFGVAAEYDWAAVYATIDVASLLQVLPELSVGVIRGLTLNPYP